MPFLKNINLPKCVNSQAVLHEIIINNIMLFKRTKHNVKIVLLRLFLINDCPCLPETFPQDIQFEAGTWFTWLKWAASKSFYGMCLEALNVGVQQPHPPGSAEI